MQNDALSANVEPELPAAEAAADETRSLRRCMRDLAGLSALSVVWVGYDAQRLAESLADVLGSTLDLRLVFVRVHSPASGAVFEAARTGAQFREPPAQVEELARTLAPWLEPEFATTSASVPHPCGSGTLQITVTRIGYGGHGVILTGSERTSFPTECERLLLSVTANQAVVVLQQREGEAERGQALVREQQRAQQLQRLARASLAINSALALPDLLQEITDRAREIIGAQQGVTSVAIDDDWERAFHAFSPAGEEVARPRDCGSGNAADISPAGCEPGKATRGTCQELRAGGAGRGSHPDAPPQVSDRDWLAAPLTGRSGQNFGLIQLSYKDGGPFTEEDEAILVQLAQLASVAIENSRLHERTQDAEQRLRVLVNSLNAILWEADPQTLNTTFVSQRAESLLGYPVSRWLEPGFFESILHPGDREWTITRCREATAEGRDYDLEYRVLAADGRVVWLHDIACVLKDPAGQAVHLGGVMVDVTEWKRLDEQLRSSEEQFRTLVEQSPLSIQVLSPEGETLQVNRAWEQLWGTTLEQLEAARYNILQDEQLVQKGVMPYIQRAFAGEAVAIPPVEYDRAETLPHLVGDEEPRRWTRAHIYPVRDEAGTIQKVVLIHEDYTDRKLLEDALAQRLEELAVSSRRKDEFLAMLAHELRNPLAPIRNAAHLLKLRRESDPALRRTQGIIERQVTHLTRMVDDLLDVARINRGHIELRKTELDLAEIIGDAVEAVREAVDSRGHHLSVLLPLEPVRVHGDRTRLVQVIGNVLTNAAKYTANGGRIQLVAELEGDGPEPQVALHFRDNGQGIAPELLPHVFDLFTQAERSLDRSEGGLGIGLTLVKELVQQHGGTIEAHSAGPGRGSEFVVRFPALRPVAPRRQETRQDQAISGPGRRVLLVEDNRDAAATLQEILEVWGHEVEVAHDGPAALQVAPDFQPEVVLLDIGLPQMDGYEVARRLRMEGGAGGAFLVALTGYGHAEHRTAAEAAGFDHHLVKPVDLEQLQHLLAYGRNTSVPE